MNEVVDGGGEPADDDAEEGEILEDGEIADEDDQQQCEDSNNKKDKENKEDNNSSRDNKEQRDRDKGTDRDRDKDKFGGGNNNARDRDKSRSREESSRSSKERRRSGDKDKDKEKDKDKDRDIGNKDKDKDEKKERERRSSERDKRTADEEERERRRRARAERERKRKRDEEEAEERLKRRREFQDMDGPGPGRGGPFEDRRGSGQSPFGGPGMAPSSSDDEDDWEDMLQKMSARLKPAESADDSFKRMRKDEKKEMFKKMIKLIMGGGDSTIRNDPEISRWRDRRERNRERRRRERTPGGGPTGARPGRGGHSGHDRRESYKTVCKFYLDGKCHKGADCPFSHDGSPAKRKEICKFYLQGFCGKSDNCLYMHGEFPCKFFHTGVECYSGDNCRFSHQPLTPDTREILRNYLDSGELPDDPKPDRDQSRFMNNNDQNNKSESGVEMLGIVSGSSGPGGDQDGHNQSSSIGTTTTTTTISTTYIPMKPVSKRHAVLGEPTHEMRNSYYTWIWQQEMKELELAYVGNKRNLFCIEKQFVINEKPCTPRMEDDEEEVEAQIRSYYRDTLGVEDPDTLKAEEEEKLLQASALDEDLRSFTMPMMQQQLGGGDMNQAPVEQNQFAQVKDTDDDQQANQENNAVSRKRRRSGGDTSDSEDDEHVMKNVMKNLNEPGTNNNSTEPNKMPLDITKMLNAIRQSSRQAPAPTSQADFWQNMFSNMKGSSPTGSGSPASNDPRQRSRDPRLKQRISDLSMSPPSNDNNSSTPIKICDPSAKIDYRLVTIDVPDIDYKCYVSMYQNDQHLKNDPRLQKFFSKMPDSVIDHLSRIVPPPLKTAPLTPLSALKSKMAKDEAKKKANKEKMTLLMQKLSDNQSSSMNTTGLDDGDDSTAKGHQSSPSPPLPPLPPLMISPTKAPTQGIIPPPPPPIMSPLELISSKPSSNL